MKIKNITCANRMHTLTIPLQHVKLKIVIYGFI